MTQDEADQKFFTEARRRSPRYPDVATQLERRRQSQENLAARLLLWGLAPAGLITSFWSTFGWVMVGTGIIGFICVCVASSERQHKRRGSPSGNPF